MKKSHIELLLITGFIGCIILALLNHSWIKPFLFITLLGLLINWIFSLINNRRNGGSSLVKSELIERFMSFFLILGLTLNVAEISFSNLTISFGLLILIIHFVIKAFKKFRKKEIISGIELIVLVLIFLGNLMNLRHFPGGSFIKSISMTILALFYLGLSIEFIIYEVKNNRTALGVTGLILYWCLSALINAIQFDVFYWPGYKFIYWSGFVGILILAPVLLFQIKKYNDSNSKTNSLLKRIVVISSLGLFFAVATPKQNLRLDFGNRPQMIDAYYDCRLNNNLSETLKNEACEEFFLLIDIQKFGYYIEGLNEEDIEIIKQDFLSN